MNFPLFPDMLHEHLVSRLREQAEKRLERLSAIKTRKQARTYCDSVRRKLRACLGPFPGRTPLHVRVTNEIACDGYTLQTLWYESRPGYVVTANFYLPEGGDSAPCVLGACGHSENGKAEPAYQSFCQGLVKQGYLVLIPDPVSQGERKQFLNPREGQAWPGGSCTREHNMIAKAQRLVGEQFCTWRVWDKIRSLDVLLAHPRADRTRVGVTGNSGGGTMTSFLAALDPRITMAAPGCYVTTLLRNLENSLPADAEQCPPGLLAAGLDMGDFFLAYAPRPTLFLGQKYDFFDVRGLRETFEQVKRIYRLLGAPGNIEMFIGPGGHGYGLENREAMYRFFNRHTDGKGSKTEKRIGICPVAEETLYAVPKGNVRNVKSRRACEYTAQRAGELQTERKPLSEKALLDCARSLLKLKKRRSIPPYRTLQVRDRARGIPGATGFRFQTQYLIETEPGVRVVLNRFLAEQREDIFILDPPKELNLFLPHFRSEEELRARRGTAMGGKTDDAWFLEPRGLGETMARDLAESDFTSPYGLDYMHAATYEMLNQNLLGRRVHDILAGLDLLVECGGKRVHLHGRGMGAILAAFAGLLHSSVRRVTLIGAPLSYFEMTQAPVQSWPFSAMLPNILHHFDLPDLYRILARKKRLRLRTPWTPQWRPYTPEAIRRSRKKLNLTGVKIR